MENKVVSDPEQPCRCMLGEGRTRMAMRSDTVSAEQLFNRSDDGNRYELIRGELHMMSPAGGRHRRVAHNLGLILGRHVRRAGLGAVYAAETGFLIARDPDTVRAPDVAFVSHPRLQQIGDDAGYVPLGRIWPGRSFRRTIVFRMSRKRRSAGWRRVPASYC